VQRSNTCGLDVGGFFVAGVFDDFGCDIAKRASGRGELLVGRVKEFCSVER